MPYNPFPTIHQDLGRGPTGSGGSSSYGSPYVSSAPFADWQGFHEWRNGGGPTPLGPQQTQTGNMPGQKPNNPQDFLAGYQLQSRYPEITSATGNAFNNIAQMGKNIGVPDFNALKKQFSTATGDMNNWYNRYQQGNDLSGYAAGQRAADAAATAETGRYADVAHGILGDAANSLSRYRTEGQGALDKVLANAQDFYNKDIPASIADAQNRAVQYTSRYGLGRGGGMGSDIGQIAGRSAIQAALPFQLEGRRFVGDALGRYQPFYGDVASRDYSRIAGLNLPTEQNIYGARQGDILRGKATEQQLQNLGMMVKERGLNAAIQNLKLQGLPEQIISELVNTWQGQQGRQLGLAGQAAGLEQQYGAERGYYDRYGAPVTKPQYFPLPQPRFPSEGPGRYDAPNQPWPAPGAPGAPVAPPGSPLAQLASRYSDPPPGTTTDANYSYAPGVNPWANSGGYPAGTGYSLGQANPQDQALYDAGDPNMDYYG